MLKLRSPAKINLFLRVMGKRSDGYHDLASLFQAIDLADTLTFELSREDEFSCSVPNLSLDGSNLVIKALQLFRQKTELPFRVKIHLEKHIPMQAGMGGGSSNAATTLWALNALHNFPFSDYELQDWSSSLGSDVPFFFANGTAYCTGRGETVRPLAPLTLPENLSWFKPREGLSTPAVFKALDLSLCSKIDPEELLEAFYSQKFQFINDLQEPAFRLLPILRTYQQELLAKGWSDASMTGSGTAFFGTGGADQIVPLQRLPLAWY